MSRALDTRSKILSCALQLFNEQGVDNTTTNHIAAAAAISPGNLYYHYKNKEAIIRALVQEQLAPAVDEIWRFAEARALSLEDLRSMLRQHFELFWQFRFLRDFLVLMRNDPLFAEGHRAIYQLRMDQFAQLTDRFVQAGLLRPPSEPNFYRKIVEAGWVITNFWLAHLAATGIPTTPESMQQGADLVLLTLQPYFQNQA